MYALLSAIEQDLRAAAGSYLPDADPINVLGQAYEPACRRFVVEQGVEPVEPKLADLLPFVDFADSWQILNANAAELPDALSAHLKRFTSNLDGIAPVRNRIAHNRPLDYDDYGKTLDLAHELAASRDFPWLNLRDVTERLKTDPAYVLAVTPIFATELTAPERHNLPSPEYDETGFVGRQESAKTLRRLLLRSPYPVISVVGDGGIGKTSLALKVAFDLVDMSPCPFEAVVWVTAKTSLLTATEIIRIEGAIGDSLGMISAVAREVGGEAASSNPINEVLQYLEHFRILLILDNLETVLDQTLRTFLSNLPSGSKVLITSRVGVGAYEHPVRLGPLDRSEGIALFRALIRMRKVEVLASLDQPAISRLVDQLGCRPLYIRWFVSAVETGARPEALLSNSDLFLDYCMSNVFDFLSQQSQAVLRSMQALPGAHGQAELAYLNDMEVDTLQDCLLQLANTYFVSLEAAEVGGGLETEYQLTDFARTYLDRQHPVSRDERSWLLQRRDNLAATGRQLQSQHQGNPLSRRTLDTRDMSDFSVAQKLINAISLIMRNQAEAAMELISESKELAPGYHEVHRVEADLYVSMRDFASARQAYERAVELGPLAVPLRFMYGKFLCGLGSDPREGLAQFQTAVGIAPSEARLILEVARAHLQLAHLEEAKAVSSALLERRDISQYLRRLTAGVAVQACVREAQQACDNSDWSSGVGALQELSGFLHEVTTSALDAATSAVLDQARALSNICQRKTNDAYVSRIAVDVMAALASATVDGLAEFEAKSYGRVARIVAERAFGFIVETGTGKEFFFHMSDFRKRSDWESCIPEVHVSFIAAEGDRGPHAKKILLLG
jgi:LuxR family glucitol operon transcriptional activator